MVTGPAAQCVLTISTATSAPGGNHLPQVLMVVGVLMIGFLMVISVRSKIARRNAARPSPEAR